MRKTLIVATVVAGLLAACTSPVPRPPASEEQRPPGFPDAFYEQAAARGRPVFEIDPARSLVVIEVRRAGSLARLGHDHVVASRDVRGYVAPDDGRADLYLRLDRLVVDEPELRAEAAFDTQPSEAAIAGTRENMLAQLRAELHPHALVAVRSVDTDAAGPGLHAGITLNGVTHTTRIPVRIETSAGQLDVAGRVALLQTQFGIVPLSVLGGALQVQDRVDVRFTLRARRVLP